MKIRIMIDIETLGNKPGSVILSIGAVIFTNDRLGAEFYERIDPKTCVDAGLVMDVSTVMWWLKQSDAAREEITKPAKPLTEVLALFSAWIGEDEAEIWGNGASFDNAVLTAAYDICRIPRPWKYSNDRCYRTIKNLYPEVPLLRQGVHHDALDDAATQATHLIEIFKSAKIL